MAVAYQIPHYNEARYNEVELYQTKIRMVIRMCEGITSHVPSHKRFPI